MLLHSCPRRFCARLRTRPGLVIDRGDRRGIEESFSHCSTFPVTNVSKVGIIAVAGHQGPHILKGYTIYCSAFLFALCLFLPPL